MAKCDGLLVFPGRDWLPTAGALPRCRARRADAGSILLTFCSFLLTVFSLFAHCLLHLAPCLLRFAHFSRHVAAEGAAQGGHFRDDRGETLEDGVNGAIDFAHFLLISDSLFAHFPLTVCSFAHCFLTSPYLTASRRCIWPRCAGTTSAWRRNFTSNLLVAC